MTGSLRLWYQHLKLVQNLNPVTSLVMNAYKFSSVSFRLLSWPVSIRWFLVMMVGVGLSMRPGSFHL